MISILFQKFKGIDYQLFHFINQTIKNPFLDRWMPIVTNIDNWMWVLVLGWIALFIFGGKKGRLVCILAILTLLIADNLISYILKPFFNRPRPLVPPELAHTVSPSFPSNHATNVFTLAMVLGWHYKRLSPICFIGAGIVGFSRVYTGVHYPFDIVGGAFVGIICALFVIWVSSRVKETIRRFYVRNRHA